ncbi:hypothetical protein ALI22I_13800 [Saccharothrix sp. ALI-22-I]|nr:hypothetical protein ALI22I_13800 [Saccharothrix sp. ALI-22-I]
MPIAGQRDGDRLHRHRRGRRGAQRDGRQAPRGPHDHPPCGRAGVPRGAAPPVRPGSHTGTGGCGQQVRGDQTRPRRSGVSAPAIQAAMLEQADLRSRMRVLEIGSGGYNAALLAEIVGPAGHVVSIDIDFDVVERARRLLAEAGYPAVRVVHGDAEHPIPDEEPFDRIIVTVGAWDLPPAWWEQLVEGGRIVVPLLMRGTTRTVALDKVEGRLVDRDHQRAGFVAMQGHGARSGPPGRGANDRHAGRRPAQLRPQPHRQRHRPCPARRRPAGRRRPGDQRRPRPRRR